MTNRELDLTILGLLCGVKIVYYSDWDTKQEFNPQYIPSGKPVRTHMIDLKPIPSFSTDPCACYSLKLKMTERFHWIIKSPFSPNLEWHAGLTPLNITGWNGVPDFQESGETEMIAVCKVSLRAYGFDPEIVVLPKLSTFKY